MKNFRVKSLVTLLSVAALSGCAATRDAKKNYGDNLKISQNSVQGAEPRSSVSVADPSQDRMSNFGRVQRNWVNPVPLPRTTVDAERSRLPAVFQKQVSFTMPGRVTLVEVLSELQRANSIKVNINQDIYDSTVGEAVIVGAGNRTNTNTVAPVTVNDFVFRGSLENALDLLASKANISWKWNGSAIDLFRYETRSYNVTLLAGKTTANSEVTLESDTAENENNNNNNNSGGLGVASATNNAGTSAAGTTSSSAKQGVSRTATLDSWGDVKNYLLSLMSPQGTIAVMESTGLVTVRDTPDVQRKITSAVKELNALIGKQIYINVDVYAITKDASDDYGLDWNIAWGSLRNNVSYNTASGSAATNKINIGILTGPFAGSTVVAQALSKLGKTSVVNQFQITTLNGQPTPIGNNRKIPYISGIQVQQDANGNPIQSVTTGAVYQGISMSVIPKVQPNGKILLEYAMNLSDFQGFTDFSTGSGNNAQTLSLPTTTLKNILQRASLRSGQALVLSGFKQSVSTVNKNGVGSPSNYLFGGGSAAQQQEQYLVIMVTPFVAQDNE
jgi:type IVB pilus formation R64 PilN family outer membrane protein